METGRQIIEIAMANGADLAGLASVKDMRASASHTVYPQMGEYGGVGTPKDEHPPATDELFNWPAAAKSLLVIGLSHPEEKPELDWWDGKGTPGNRMLIDIMARTRKQIENDLTVKTHKLHYYVEKGGIFLKDAAVLAGLGGIGENNLLITPTYGPRIRLRALFLEAEIEPTGPIEFDPCQDCKVYCRRVCPEKAMAAKVSVFDAIDDTADLPARDGTYDRIRCNNRMEKDITDSQASGAGEQQPIKFCRKCEFICPVGK